MNGKIIYPPKRVRVAKKDVSVFLAGSIDMGNAEDWQAWIGPQLIDEVDFVFNPRRPDWNSDWKQTADDPNMVEQVNWELDHIESADIRAFYFDRDSRAPISFLELGWCAAAESFRPIVYCPEGFYRKGNVDIFCKRLGISVYKDREEWRDHLLRQVRAVKAYKKY